MKAVNAFSTFAVKNIKKSKDFYSKTLGLKTSIDKMGMLNLDLFGGRMMAYEKADLKPANNTILTLVITNIDKAVDDLAKKGVKFTKFPSWGQDKKGIVRANEYGPSITWFKDPSGNIISIIEDGK